MPGFDSRFGLSIQTSQDVRMDQQSVITKIVELANAGVLEDQSVEDYICDDVTPEMKVSLRDPNKWEIVWDSTPEEYSMKAIGMPHDPVAGTGMPMAIREGVDPTQVVHLWHGLCDVEQFDSRLVIEFLELTDGSLTPNQNVGD